MLTFMKSWLADHLPQSFVGALDFYRYPEQLDSWGGPFNGQCFRQTIFIDLVRACNFDAVIETGTYRGSTTLFLALNSGGAPVYTSEIDGRVFALARRRLRAIPNIRMYNTDSRKFLSALNLSDNGCKLFYLDAHWLKISVGLDMAFIPDFPLASSALIFSSGCPASPRYGRASAFSSRFPSTQI